MLTFEDLKHKDCRWPSESQNGEILYCGEPVLNDGPYCAVHAAIAYNRPSRRGIPNQEDLAAATSNAPPDAPAGTI